MSNILKNKSTGQAGFSVSNKWIGNRRIPEGFKKQEKGYSLIVLLIPTFECHKWAE